MEPWEPAIVSHQALLMKTLLINQEGVKELLVLRYRLIYLIVI